MSGDGTVLLVDVGSASIGAALAEADAGRMRISRTFRVELPNASGEHTGKLADLALATLKKTFAEFARAAEPSSVHVFLAAPWYASRIRAIELESGRELKISRGTIEKAVRDHRAAEGARPGATEIESSVSRTFVNDYPTAVSGTLRGNALSIDLYESAADTSFVSGIRAIAREAFPRAPFSLHSFLYALFAVLRALREEESFVVVDVGGEITDVAVVRRGSIRFSGSFPVGSLSFMRSAALKGSMADASSRLSLYARGELSDEEAAAFKKIYDTVTGAWNRDYRALLESALREGPVSGTVFVAADPETLPWFERAVAEAEAPLRQKAVLLGPDFFQTRTSLGRNASYDAFLSAEALYALSVRL